MIFNAVFFTVIKINVLQFAVLISSSLISVNLTIAKHYRASLSLGYPLCSCTALVPYGQYGTSSILGKGGVCLFLQYMYALTVNDVSILIALMLSDAHMLISRTNIAAAIAVSICFTESIIHASFMLFTFF